jgi:hypothetical protein
MSRYSHFRCNCRRSVVVDGGNRRSQRRILRGPSSNQLGRNGSRELTAASSIWVESERLVAIFRAKCRT